jgi:hypothetical protein
MTEFLNSLKADFLDRRLLPFIALVVVALAAAVGYVALDSGSSSSATPTGSPAVTAQAGASHLTISQLTPEKAVAEVPTGAASQHEGYARNPFEPVVKPKTASTTASTTTTSGTSGSAGGSSPETSSKSSAGKEPTPVKKPTKPKPKIVYHVAALFGLVPAGGATPGTELTPFVNIPLLTPLPSAEQPLIDFRGVTTGGKSATFTVLGEVILHGSATCLPSEQQCEAIDLPVGKSELLEYLPGSGPLQVYELKIVSIASSKASTAAVQSLIKGESKAGRELLHRSGLSAIPDLHYSSQYGVLAFASRKAFAARAHGASRR